MKEFITDLKGFDRALCFVLYPSSKPTNPILDEIYDSVVDLDYYSAGMGRKQISNDFRSVGKDLKNASKEAITHNR